jgi:hypothetical protein
MLIQGSSTGAVVLLRKTELDDPFSCDGAETATNLFDGTKIKIFLENETATLPSINTSALAEGTYSVCFCGSTDYPGCISNSEWYPGVTGVTTNRSAPRVLRANQTYGPPDAHALQQGDFMTVW